jgi:DNA mismatch endonuclease, patch repair protein
MNAAAPPDPKRSALMARVRQKGTAAELAVAAALRHAGRAYRLNVKALPGSPDFANRKDSWAIFVHGCFWHRHPGCVRTTNPKANAEFWKSKFAANQARDSAALRALARMGFAAAAIWECETRNPDDLAQWVSDFFAALPTVESREAALAPKGRSR